MTTPSGFWVLKGVGSVVILALIGIHLDWAVVAKSFGSLGIMPVLAAIAGMVIASLIGGPRWWLFLKALGYPHSMAMITRVRLVAQALNLLLPTGLVGDLAQVFFVADAPERTVSRTLGTVLAERIVGLMGFIVLGVAAFALTLSEAGGGEMAAVKAGIASLLVMALGLAAMATLVWLDRRVRPGIGLARCILASLAAMALVVASYRRMPVTVALALILTLIGHLTIAGAIWLIASALGPVGFVHVVLAVSAVAVATLVPITINGLGLREGLFILLLAPAGLGAEGAAVVSLTWFAISLIAATALALAALPGLPDLGPLERAGLQRFRLFSR